MFSKVALPEIEWKRGTVPLGSKKGQYLVLSDIPDYSENDYIVADFDEDGDLDTHGYIPEEEIIAHAYLPAQQYQYMDNVHRITYLATFSFITFLLIFLTITHSKKT